jgi:hypothetical protein
MIHAIKVTGLCKDVKLWNEAFSLQYLSLISYGSEIVHWWVWGEREHPRTALEGTWAHVLEHQNDIYEFKSFLYSKFRDWLLSVDSWNWAAFLILWNSYILVRTKFLAAYFGFYDYKTSNHKQYGSISSSVIDLGTVWLVSWIEINTRKRHRPNIVVDCEERRLLGCYAVWLF